MSRHSLPAADAAWLHMDRATNPMVVNAVIWFDEPLDWERAKDVFRERMVDCFPRFSQRVAEPLGRPAFEDDPRGLTSTSTCTALRSRRQVTELRCRSSSATSSRRRSTARARSGTCT